MWRDDRIDTYRDSRDYSNLLGSRASEAEYEPSKSRQDFLRRREAIQGILKSKEKSRSSDPGPSNTSKRSQGSQEPKRELPFDKSFGSFFGPSQPIVAKRVLEEDRNRYEARLLAARAAKQATSQAKQKQVSSSSKTVAKTQKPVKPLSKSELKIQKLKEARDYSFLFSENDDAVPQSKPATPAPKLPPSRPSSGASTTSRPSDPRKPSSTSSRPAHSTPPSRPVLKTPVTAQRPSSNLPRPKTNDVSRRPGTITRPVSVPQTRPVPQASSKPKAGTLSADRGRLSDPVRRAPAARPSNESVRTGASSGSVRPRPANGSVRHESSVRADPYSNGSARPSSLKQKPLPVKRPRPAFEDEEEEDVDYRRFLPKQFRMDYKQRYDDDGYDSSDMEADFHTIQAEEARSLRIARQEDEAELAKIQEEERLENLRKKRRKN